MTPMWKRSRSFIAVPGAVLAAAVVTAACGGKSSADPDAAGAPVDAAPDAVVDATPVPDADPFNPATLRETGLYSDFDNEVLADRVVEYTVEAELWSDGATKKRWAFIPSGTTIDTTDMDFWTYPEGTKLWKEFARDGIRLETRILWKQGPTANDWYVMAFAWNDAQTEAVAVRDGVTDAQGTEHDIPSRSTCRKCHSRQPDYVLGFSAILLDHDLGGVTLDSLKTDGVLSAPPAGVAPYFDVPGDAVEGAALSYFHVNCGGCHHDQSDVMDTTDINLRLYVEQLSSPAVTATYVSTINVEPKLAIGADKPLLVVPGDPEASNIFIRMNARSGTNLDMPPEGTEIVDPVGTLAVDTWIRAL